ncbi:MAG: hypothetical protein A2161_11000 [Candidatus Schekmanbacteria bacterium RBG_13_48_7]|uniref:phosphoserine phosphatase n=1 Tax=Candidatus Schekmanbacteria bacterium RBG_13_48_7 TaxID=1817878 RepID=A0A1F7S8R2_9BACT|nr:MAG: hypothetical protein A2161_11000 [Candidatus Schekmanbacteria bacterium RBG_13_48_7]
MKKIIGFDVDGTLVANIPYSWEEFHRVFDIDRKKLKLYYDLYHNGKISFDEWGMIDTDLWKEKNLHKTDFVDAIHTYFHLAEGTIEVLETLRTQNYIIAVISGSLSIVLEVLIPEYQKYFSHLYIGHLDFDEDGYINKYVSGKLLKNGREYKLGELEDICKKESIPLSQTIFIGDNENDISALHGAGLGIGFLPRSKKVVKAANVVIRETNLLKILDYL